MSLPLLVVSHPRIYLCDRLDRQTQATTFIHQVFGGYLRSRGKLLVLICFLDLFVLFEVKLLFFVLQLMNKLDFLFQLNV